jgi:hypothetical protein
VVPVAIYPKMMNSATKGIEYLMREDFVMHLGWRIFCAPYSALIQNKDNEISIPALC